MNYLEILNKLRADSPLSKEELEVLLAWVLSEEGKRSIEEEVLNDWNSFETADMYDYKRLLDKLNRRIDNLEAQKTFLYRKYIRYAVEAAAVVIVAAGVSFFTVDGLKKRYLRQVEARNPEMIEVYNPKGLRTTITLPDSSKVTLNADSKITYLKNFLPDKRTVQMEGEAFFEVTKDPSRPFIVQTGDVKMTVLGTSFNVCSYPENEYIATTLIEGSICVEAKKDARTLIPGTQSRIDKTLQENHIREVNTKNVTGWIDGKLYFSLTPFSEIMTILERKFCVNIQVRNNVLLQKSFTGKFEHNENLDQIIKILTLSVPSTSVYHKETNTLIIR